jgi:hypothetical protein
MRDHHELFGWRITRALFAVGGLAFFAGILLLVLAASSNAGWLMLAGLGLVALSTRGPWDSEASGRNRSVLGFHARPGKEVPR